MRLRTCSSLAILVATVLVNASLAGCGQDAQHDKIADTTDAGAPTPSAPPETDTADAGSDSGIATCNTLTQQGSPVPVINTQAAPQQPLGGTIPDGTYVLTSAKIWGSTAAEGSKAGTAAAQTWVVNGSTVEMISTTAKSGTISRQSATMAISGDTITMTQTCVYPVPDGGSGALASANVFTATATSFSMYTPSLATTYEFVYSRQ